MLWRVSGYNKLRYSGIGAYCSTGAVHLAYIAYFLSTMNASVARVDVRVLQRIFRVVSGIWADTISDAWPHVG